VKNIYFVLIIAFLFSLFISGCGGKDKSDLPTDKLVQIAIWEDRREANTQLYDYLSDPDPKVCARAIYTLGLIAPEGISAYIGDLLSDNNAQIRLEAAFIAGLLGDSLSAKKLIPLTSDPELEVRHQAIISLGKVGGQPAITVLNDLIVDTLPKIRAWAAEGLWRAKAEGSIELLNNLTTDSVIAVEWAAVYALRQMADSSSIDKLRFRIRDTIPEIRMEAIRALQILADSGSLIGLSNALAHDKDWRVKANLLSAIRTVGTKKVIRALMNMLNEDEHPLVIELAMSTIAHFKLKTVSPRIRPFLESKNRIVKGATINALAELEGDNLLNTIKDEVPSYDWYIKGKVAQAMTYLKSTQAANMAETLLSDSDPRVRSAALGSLMEIDSVEVIAAVKTALNDPDWGVVATAVDVVSEKKMIQYLDKVTDIYKKSDDNDDLRFGIIYSMEGWIEDSLISEPKVTELLEIALKDNDRTVRNRAIEILKVTGVDRSEMLGLFETNISSGTYGDYYGKYDINPIAEINTEKGQIRIELLYDKAPKTVVNFITLAESGYYDSTIFHRVVPNFVIQGGDPLGNGMGGPGYTIRCEYNRHEYDRGTVGMAHAGKDTGGSQFFICHSAQPHLNGRYTAFGQVVYGMRIVDRILIGDMIENVEIVYPKK
jgi:cyclophilin family peptidyl-prolyl cis-trans isomerase/HEAT repeat protein